MLPLNVLLPADLVTVRAICLLRDGCEDNLTLADLSELLNRSEPEIARVLVLMRMAGDRHVPAQIGVA